MRGWTGWTEHRGWDAARWLLLAGALVYGSANVFPYADCYHDGTRLATIDSLGNRGTLCIDGSVYCLSPPPSPKATPYRSNNPNFPAGTLDKIRVDGRFYSHHPPVSLLILGGVYRVWRAVGGPDPADDPAGFAVGLTILSSVVPFVLSAALLGRMARRLVGVSAFAGFVLVLTYTLGTAGAAYSRHVNSHILVLFTLAGVCYAMAAVHRFGASGWRLIGLGTAVGATYSLDGAIGPATVAAVGGYLLLKREWRSLVVVGLAALPWAVVHHAVVYAVTGSVGSPAANPAFWTWEGCPFSPDELTGSSIKHADAVEAYGYAYQMLFGQRGFVLHHPPMLMALAAGLALVVRRPADRWPAVFAGVWMGACAVPYILGSNNLSGRCMTIRWFLPLLAPAFWLLATAAARIPLTVVGLCAVAPVCLRLGWEMYAVGPWVGEWVPDVYELNMQALAAWGTAGVLTAGWVAPALVGQAGLDSLAHKKESGPA